MLLKEFSHVTLGSREARVQGTKNSTLIRTGLWAQLEVAQHLFSELLAPVSATGSDSFGHRFLLEMNFEVRPILLESSRDNISNKKRFTQFRVRMQKFLKFEVRCISAVRISVQNTKNLDSNFSCTQSDVGELLEQHLIISLCFPLVS